MKITGIKELTRALDKLPDELRKGADRRVLAAGAKPIVKAARAKAAKSSGLLRKSIGQNVKKMKGEYTARIGPRKGMGAMVVRNGVQVYSNPTQYAHLVEYGTSHSAPQPFVRPAVESSKSEVVAAMAAGLDKHLTSAVRRIRSRKS